MSASDGYRLVERIGSGPSGSVYIAETGGTKVVIRQFESAFAPGSEAWKTDRRRFLDAGSSAVSLTHSRIVPSLEVIDEGGEAFVTSEYVDTETLEAALAKRQFTPQETAVLLRQIALGLDYAHAQGVVHGDLKPSDVFLNPDRGARVADFAISARARRDTAAPIPANLVHAYLSPEHLSPPTPLSPRSDQYSLAVIAYRMYVGQTPPQQGAIPPPSSVNRSLPSGIDAPLLKALDRDPSKRFGSCKEFISVMDSVLITAPEIRASRWQSKGVYAGLGVAALALVLGGVTWLNRPPDTGKKSAPSPPATEPVKREDTSTRAAESAAKTDTKVKPAASPKTEARRADDGVLPRESPAVNPAAPSLTPAPASTIPAPPKATAQDFSPATPPTRMFTISVFSRKTRVLMGSSFRKLDPTLGELAHGDLTAVVGFDGPQPPKGKLTLEWTVDGTVMDNRAVVLNQPVEYGNEPTKGTYQVTVRLDRRPAGSFSFRINP